MSMLRMPRGWSGLLFCWCMMMVSTVSAEFQDHATILQQAQDFMFQQARAEHGEHLDIEVIPGRLDPRLRLRQCTQGVEAYLGPSSRLLGNTTVGVRCAGPVQWSLFVPVEVVVRGAVVVVTQSLPRGTVLESGHIRLQTQDLSGLHSGYVSALEVAQDAVLRRAVQLGTVLTPQMLEPRRLVQRGQQVLILVENAQVAVRAEGEALEHGSLGERVRVRNSRSSRIVEGVVAAPGVIRVEL